MKNFLWQRKNWFISLSLLFLLVLSLAACGNNANGNGSSKPTSTAGTGVNPLSTPSSNPIVKIGAQPCPDEVKDPAHWDPIIPTHHPDSQVRSVSCGYLMGTPTLQALITINKGGSGATLDAYIFNNITDAHPTRLFKLQGLVKGDAKISGNNTILTAEVDQNSTLNAGKSSGQWTQDLFREFEWKANKGTLVQIAFPGIFPDLTRYQAEADQANVNQGHQPWKNDPAQVAKALVVQFLQWNRPLTATVMSGGGPHDVYATLKVQEAPLQGAQYVGPSVNVTLSRLNGNTHNMWVANAVADGQALSIENIDARSQIDNPVKIEGKGNAFEGVIGKAFVLDHLYNDIGHTQVMGIPGIGIGNTTYSTMMLYSTSFHKGVQEGIVEVQEANGGISSEAYSAVMVKVLLAPEPGVALGPLPGPKALSDPAYWTPFVTAPPLIAVADKVTFGNLLGKPSLQAMVVARQILGCGPVFRSVFVFDNITAPTPKLVFKVEHLRAGDARISGYSTILTAEVDLNSSLNKGKPYAALTTDLFREFQWSEGKRTFVQIAFPGLFPDLTRYQAEKDQLLVNQGHQPWKLDALLTTKLFAKALLRTPPDSAVVLVSGGGVHDVDAVVHVTPSVLVGCCGPFPPIKVTLSRLEGNTSNGIWIVVGVASEYKKIIAPQHGDRLTSPVAVTGSGSQFESQVGIVHLLDHLYTDIGQSTAMGTSGFGLGPFSVNVSYEASFQGGAQEGIVVLYDENGGGTSLHGGVAMVKVLLNP
jgi:Immunoglobulin-like domain of bacterial spore germination